MGEWMFACNAKDECDVLWNAMEFHDDYNDWDEGFFRFSNGSKSKAKYFRSKNISETQRIDVVYVLISNEIHEAFRYAIFRKFRLFLYHRRYLLVLWFPFPFLFAVDSFIHSSICMSMAQIISIRISYLFFGRNGQSITYETGDKRKYIISQSNDATYCLSSTICWTTALNR